MKKVIDKKIKIIIVTDYKDLADKFFNKYKKHIEIVKKDPDFVVSFGGDGTFFKSEFLYPNLPKIYLKNSRIGKLAFGKTNEEIISHIIKSNFQITEKTKLEVFYKNKKKIAMGDILIHNKDLHTAIRMKVYINDSLIQKEEVIGDGLLVATQLGSTGYYKSITRSYFESDENIGLAFNNSIDQINHIVLKKEREIKIEITRGIAEVFADNQKDSWKLDKGDELFIRVSSQKLKIVSF
ncbi:MAG: NAD(+)/NADH kinase [Candidatus Pacebacteria bacterium]|mgnify:CR=1 FL=1|nr:NAD(+)/NADH kinase [Candidatus Paceibacterota bacterium]